MTTSPTPTRLTAPIPMCSSLYSQPLWQQNTYCVRKERERETETDRGREGERDREGREGGGKERNEVKKK